MALISAYEEGQVWVSDSMAVNMNNVMYGTGPAQCSGGHRHPAQDLQPPGPPAAAPVGEHREVRRPRALRQARRRSQGVLEFAAFILLACLRAS